MSIAFLELQLYFGLVATLYWQNKTARSGGKPILPKPFFLYIIHSQVAELLLRHCHDPLIVRLHKNKYCEVSSVTISIQLSDYLIYQK